jgi:hypothetical protein
VYQEALKREFLEQAIPYEREHALPSPYRCRPLLTTYLPGGFRLFLLPGSGDEPDGSLGRHDKWPRAIDRVE